MTRAIRAKKNTVTLERRNSKRPKRSHARYKGFSSYEQYYDNIILGPADNLYAVLTGSPKAKKAPKSSGRQRPPKTVLR